jgi:hypothetical protein
MEAFFGCATLEGFQKMTSSSNDIIVTNIGTQAFYGCASLTFAGVNSLSDDSGISLSSTKKISNNTAGVAIVSKT